MIGAAEGGETARPNLGREPRRWLVDGRLVDDERVEAIVGCLAGHFVAFGGLPLTAVFDRLRSIVQKSGRGREFELFNGTFA